MAYTYKSIYGPKSIFEVLVLGTCLGLTRASDKITNLHTCAKEV